MSQVNLITGEILQRCSQGKTPTTEELQALLTSQLKQPQLAKAFNLTEANSLEKIEARSQLFLKVCPDVMALCQQLGLKNSEEILNKLWSLWLPLAMQIAEARQTLGRTLIQGILGGQGTGKSTLAAVTRLILRHLGYSSLCVSIDDLYKTFAARKLLQQQDPRLIWRGPPGTHDVELGIKLLDRCTGESSQEPILVPRFDKSAHNGAGDRCEPETCQPVDIVLFEGWFIGARPVEDEAFDNPPEPIVTPEDKLFAKDINQQLKHYLPLWEKLDRLIVLYPVDYRVSKQWRKEAEQKMKAAGKSGMSDAEIDDFVEYFWRSLHPELFITPLVNNPDLVDLVIEINCDRTWGQVYRPGNL
ncbi:MAG: glycerate kinase [Prochloraceae cyanobacterium]|nr:glycerate kinase [Prochloraceae cyanobacterium]